MPVVNNIFNIKVNNVSSNGSISFGNTLHNSHTSNSKLQGTNSSIGDFSPTSAMTNNHTIDNDVSDQDQIGNPSSPIPGNI